MKPMIIHHFKISDFKIIKNRQRPELCYQYLLKRDGYKYTLTTFDYGKSFLIMIESKANDGRTYLKDFSQHDVTDLNKAIEIINNEVLD